jgi:DNA-binding beta-propeller fold protein YncE
VYFNKADNRQPVSLLKIDTKTGSLPPGSVVNIGHTYDYQKVGLGVASVNSGGVNISIAVAADGETAYFSGAQHAVFKAKLGDLKHRGSLLWPSRGEKIPPETMPNLFLGEAGKPGDDNAHFNMTRGIGLDEEGNIYVGDHLNDRIQVFKADGTHLRTLKVNAPQEIAVHPKTGNIYALCWRSGDVMKPPKSNVILQPRIVKVSKDGSPSAAVIELKADWNFWHNPHGICLGLDATGSEPAIWVADKQGIRKFADKGGSFAEVGRIAGGGGVGASGSLQRLAVDNETEALYFSSGSRIFNPGWYRFDGNTGKRDESFKGGGWEDMAIASDGTIVCRTPGYGRFVVRYDRDLKPLPFKDGVAPTDVPAGWPAGGKALYCGVQGHSNVHQSGLTVNPVTGDLLVRAKEINKEWWEKVAPGGNSLPAEELAGLAGWLPPSLSKSGAPEAGGLGGILLVWDAEGRPKTVQAITGLVRGQGVRADSGGNLYMGCGYDPTGAGWFGLAEPKKLTGYRSFGNLGSVFKFVSKGTYPIGSMEDKKSPAGAAWVYTGHAPCEPGDCGCAHSRFGLDRFGRAYIPSMQLYSVMVLDANGNVVLRLGRYGNADSQGKGSLVPEPDIGLGWVLAVEASDKAVYIGDQGNARILKAAIGYAAEETVPAP